MPKVDKQQFKLPEVYREYKKNTTNPVDYKTHKLVLDTWGLFAIEFLLKGRDVQLHGGLSSIGVRKYKQFTYTDLKESKEKGKQIIKVNTHSGNYAARLYWRRNRTRYDSRGWKFVPSRLTSRAIAKVMQTPKGHTNFVKKIRIYNKKAKKIYGKNILNI